jgi:hypothetical protein
MEADVAQVYFHCSYTDGLLIDRRGTTVADLIEAREQAETVVQSLLAAPSLEDWRGWVLHASDASSEEIFLLPFRSLIGKSH